MKDDDSIHFEHALHAVSVDLEKTGLNINRTSFDALIVKKLAQTNSLERGISSHQSHIAITGSQTDFFPSLFPDSYFSGDRDIKKFFLLQVRYFLKKENWIYLGGNEENFPPGENKVSVLRSNREGQEIQVQLSADKNGIDINFTRFRELLRVNDYLLGLKVRGKLEYYFFGIKSEDADAVSRLDNGFFYKKGSITVIDPDVFEESSEVVFDEYCKDEFLDEVYMDASEYDILLGLLLTKKNIILQGPPGVGKTFMAKRLAFSIMGCKDNSKIKCVQFHQSYTYEDFIEGYRPTETGFSLQRGPFLEFCEKAREDGHPHYLVIDEINRGNVSRIFGELLTLIEADKRDSEKIDLLYRKDFTIPSNIYIIGMMNTADKGLARIDYALRRRFSFYTVKPAFNNQQFKEKLLGYNNKKLSSLADKVVQLNSEIVKDSSLGYGFEIGHSYFCFDGKLASDTAVKSIIDHDLIPLIEEYWFDDRSKFEYWADELRKQVQ